MAGNGYILMTGNANPSGGEYVRMFGHNTFGFEELIATRGSDFDYNDMVMTISLQTGSLTGYWLL